jgi:hypothetical protein
LEDDVAQKLDAVVDIWLFVDSSCRLRLVSVGNLTKSLFTIHPSVVPVDSSSVNSYTTGSSLLAGIIISKAEDSVGLWLESSRTSSFLPYLITKVFFSPV